ncbi:hypothetical protein FACS1894167_06300 [Synergistales bacterium]|nr:hypothetical protein FACS1894167_06300 [Synergistales bacterium]
MCILCGEIMINIHWTDQKLHDSEYGGGKSFTGGFRRDRLRRVNYVNHILSFYGLNLKDWNGSKYILSDKKGVQKLVDNFGDMWPEAQNMCGGRIDPLDSNLLAHMNSNGGENLGGRE